MLALTILHNFLSLVALKNVWLFAIPLCPCSPIHLHKLVKFFRDTLEITTLHIFLSLLDNIWLFTIPLCLWYPFAQTCLVVYFRIRTITARHNLLSLLALRNVAAWSPCTKTGKVPQGNKVKINTTSKKWILTVSNIFRCFIQGFHFQDLIW